MNHVDANPGAGGGQRVFSGTAAYQLTWSQCTAAARLLAESTLGSTPEVTLVIGIANGGVRPAIVMSNLLRVPLHTVMARHNKSNAEWVQATGNVTCELAADLPRVLTGRILLVDDIAGSGATFAAVTEALADRLTLGAVLETVALCRNIGAAVSPDRWVWDVDAWVRFPWEDSADGRTRPLPTPKEVLSR